MNHLTYALLALHKIFNEVTKYHPVAAGAVTLHHKRNKMKLFFFWHPTHYKEVCLTADGEDSLRADVLIGAFVRTLVVDEASWHSGAPVRKTRRRARGKEATTSRIAAKSKIRGT